MSIHIEMRGEIIRRSRKVFFKRYMIYTPRVNKSGSSIFENLSHCYLKLQKETALR